MAGPCGTFLKWFPEVREINLQLCVPRLAYPSHLAAQSVNFPLRPHDEAVLRAIRMGVLDALGLRPPGTKRALDIMDWAVREVAFAADVEVSDSVAAMRALSSLKRKHSKRNQGWADDGIDTGSQWQTGDARFQVYNKGLRMGELASKGKNDDRKALLRSIAVHASNVIRLESTCLTARGVRDLFGLSAPALPKLSVVLQPEVAAYVIGRELKRLGILSVSRVSTRKVSKMRDLGLEILKARERLRDNGEILGRHVKGVTAGRLALLFAFHSLSTTFTKRELLSDWGFSEAALRELREDLTGLGLPPTRDQGPSARQAMHEIVSQLRPLISLTRPALSPEDTTDAPWAPVEADEPFTSAVADEDFSDLLLGCDFDDAPSGPACGPEDIGLDDDLS